MVPHLPCEHSQTLHREGGLFIFTVNSLFHKDIAVLGGVYLRKLALARVSHQDDFLISHKNRGELMAGWLASAWHFVVVLCKQI